MTKYTENTSKSFLDPVAHSRAEIVGLKREYPDGYSYPRHFHNRDQLVYASKGVMTVRTSAGMWIVPPLRAVWIPARTPHEVRMSGAVSLRTLYFRPRRAQRLGRSCSVVNVSSFFKELILFACQFEALSLKKREEANLIHVIMDQMKKVQVIALQLPSPEDARAQRVAEMLSENPGDEHKMEEICKAAGGSKRTIERLFLKETGISLGKWHQQSRLVQALQLMAKEEKISTAAAGAGYSTPSAFISAFRNALGTTPGKYFRQRPARRENEKR
ncbi:MAG TPA: helix-turn-helix transcriptional regulator [Verrucomicrobiae bacterium]|nr:helix-turn-helix transcriptional regulator [Verrucomicrobiae bacterium]